MSLVPIRLVNVDVNGTKKFAVNVFACFLYLRFVTISALVSD